MNLIARIFGYIAIGLILAKYDDRNVIVTYCLTKESCGITSGTSKRDIISIPRYILVAAFWPIAVLIYLARSIWPLIKG